MNSAGQGKCKMLKTAVRAIFQRPETLNMICIIISHWSETSLHVTWTTTGIYLQNHLLYLPKLKKTTSNRLSSKQPEKMASEITSKPFTNVLSVTHFSLIAQICFSHLSFITRWFLSSSQCFREKKKPELTKIPRSKVLLISDILYIENIW